VVAFDLSNIKSLNALPGHINTGLNILREQDAKDHFLATNQAETNELMLSKWPVMVVGCKKDLMDKKKGTHLLSSANVKSRLK